MGWVGRGKRGGKRGKGAQTMFPDSIEPRAKMKVTSLQAPFLRSSEVSVARAIRAGRASESMDSLVAGWGAATATAARAETMRD